MDASEAFDDDFYSSVILNRYLNMWIEHVVTGLSFYCSTMLTVVKKVNKPFNMIGECANGRRTLC